MQRGMNEYAAQLDYWEVLYKAPKNVLAAIVVSLTSQGGDLLGTPGFDPNKELIDEWQALHAAGIVPQRPPKVPDTASMMLVDDMETIEDRIVAMHRDEVRP